LENSKAFFAGSHPAKDSSIVLALHLVHPLQVCRSSSYFLTGEMHATFSRLSSTSSFHADVSSSYAKGLERSRLPDFDPQTKLLGR
jgi:hypothetical protein